MTISPSNSDIFITLSHFAPMDGTIPAEFFGPANTVSQYGNVTGPFVSQAQVQFNLTAYIKWLMAKEHE